MGVEREVGLDTDVTRRLVEVALQRTDGVTEYTESGDEFEALQVRGLNWLGDPFHGLVGTLLDIEVDHSEDGPGSTLTVGLERARKGRIYFFSELVFAHDGGLRQEFLVEFDAVVERHRESGTADRDLESLRSSGKRTERLGSKHRKLYILVAFWALAFPGLILLGGAFVRSDPSVPLALVLAIALVLSVLLTWGLKWSIGL